MSEGKEDKQELLKLYDIRVREIHHYNTMIWAFPIAYGALLAAQVRFLDGAILALLATAFNLTLCYVFYRHIQHHRAVKSAIEFVEESVKDRYGRGDQSRAFPDFKKAKAWPKWAPKSQPKATLVMLWGVLTATLLFLPVSCVLSACKAGE